MSSSTVQLGPFRLEHPFIIAPMAGITDSPFRRLMRRMKSSMVVSELVSANGIHYGGQKTLELLKYAEEERPVGLQIFGEEVGNLCEAARQVEKLGADFVDLNMGCPVPKVVRRGAGSAMCRDPLALSKTLEAMVKAVRIPLSIKIRTGWDAQSRNAGEVVRVAAESGVAWVAIHGRTRAQGYSGQADWDLLAEVKSRSPIPIIGNGDVSTPETAIEKMRSSGVDAIMIGRAALRNPFIFEQSLALWRGEQYVLPTAERYLALIEEQRSLLLEDYTPRAAMLQVRKFLAWYSSGFPGCHEFRSKVFSVADPEVLWDLARLFFEKSAKERDMKFLSQPFLMGGHG